MTVGTPTDRIGSTSSHGPINSGGGRTRPFRRRSRFQLTILSATRTVALLGAGLCLPFATIAHPPGAPVPADRPVARTDQNSQIAHTQLLEKARKGGIDVYFEGDSITRRWGATDYPDFLANWNQNFFGWNAADFGWGADTIQNILWRLDNGEL